MGPMIDSILGIYRRSTWTRINIGCTTRLWIWRLELGQDLSGLCFCKHLLKGMSSGLRTLTCK